MEPMYYIGLDVHKRRISYCVKDSGGKIYGEGSLAATRMDLDHSSATSFRSRRQSLLRVSFASDAFGGCRQAIDLVKPPAC